jgi:hypothetical protein
LADDEIPRAVVDEDFFRPPPPWVNVIVRPFVDTDEWPTPPVEDDQYRPPPPWRNVVVRPTLEVDDWVPFVSVFLGVQEDFYFSPPPWPVPYIVRSPLNVDDADEASLHEKAASVFYGEVFDRRNLFIDAPNPVPPGGWDDDDDFNQGPLGGWM